MKETDVINSMEKTYMKDRAFIAPILQKLEKDGLIAVMNGTLSLPES